MCRLIVCGMVRNRCCMTSGLGLSLLLWFLGTEFFVPVPSTKLVFFLGLTRNVHEYSR